MDGAIDGLSTGPEETPQEVCTHAAVEDLGYSERTSSFGGRRNPTVLLFFFLKSDE